MFRTITNAALAIGYGLYLTINSSKEEKQALKAELAAKRQTIETTPEPATVEPPAPATVEPPVMDDEWLAPTAPSTMPRWITTGIVHTIATQLALPPAQEVAEPPTIDYASKLMEYLSYGELTVAILKSKAKARNIKGYYNMRKAELIEALTK